MNIDDFTSTAETNASVAFKKLNEKIDKHYLGSEIFVSVSHNIVYDSDMQGYVATAMVCWKEEE